MAHRRLTRAALVLVLLAPAALLSACRKPLPTVTVYGGGRSVIVDAAAYQFPGGPKRQHLTDYAQAPTITVPAGSDLLIDVPRSVVDNAWVVAAFTLDAAGRTTPLTGAGSAGALRDRHSTRVSSAPIGVGNYFLQIVELRGPQQAGGWVVHVRTTS